MPVMRHLSVCTALVAALSAAALTVASAAAEPVDTDPTADAPVTVSPTPDTESSAPSTTPTSTTPTSTTPAAPGGAHQVTYTVTTTSDLTANIYYVSADPPNQAAANDPKFMPMARTLVGPGTPWTLQTTLTDATQWAFVSASGGLRVNPEFRCEIAVDGQVVVSQQGGSGVQCSLRPW